MSFLDIPLSTLQPADTFKFDRNALKPVFKEWISTSREWKKLLSTIPTSSDSSSEQPILTKNDIKKSINLDSLYPRLRFPFNWRSIKHEQGLNIEEMVRDKVCAKLAREWKEYSDNKKDSKNEGRGLSKRDPRTRAEVLRHSRLALSSLNDGESSTVLTPIQHPSISRPIYKQPDGNQAAQNQAAQSSAVCAPLVQDQLASQQAASQVVSQPAQSQLVQIQAAESSAIYAPLKQYQPVQSQSESQLPQIQPIQNAAVYAPPAQSQPIQNPAVYTPPVQNQAKFQAETQPAQSQPDQTSPIRAIQPYAEHTAQPQTQTQSSSQPTQVLTPAVSMPQLTQPIQFESNQTKYLLTQPQNQLTQEQPVETQWTRSQVPSQYRTQDTPQYFRAQSAEGQSAQAQSLQTQYTAQSIQNQSIQTSHSQGQPVQARSIQTQPVQSQLVHTQNPQIQYAVQPVQDQYITAQSIQIPPVQNQPSQPQTHHTVRPIQSQPRTQPVQTMNTTQFVQNQPPQSSSLQVPSHSRPSYPNVHPQLQSHTQPIQLYTSSQHELPIFQTQTEGSDSLPFQQTITLGLDRDVPSFSNFNPYTNTTARINHHRQPRE